MAKLKGPLMSLEARGSIGPGLTYSERKSGSQVRTQQKQVIPNPSFASTDNQSLYRLIIARWNSFTQNQQNAYNEEVKTENLQISGWNLFVKKAMLNPLVYLGLAGYWTFNREGSGTVLDISKNGNHGTLEPNYPADAPKYVESKNSRMRKALSFDGTNDYVDCGTGESLNITNAITFAAWMKPLVGCDGYLIARKNASDWDKTLSVYFRENTSELRFVGNGPAYVTGDHVFTGTDWMHIVISATQGGQTYFYKNGRVAGSRDTPAWSISDNALLIGARMEGIGTLFNFDGLIDEVRIYNRALSAGEIKDIYNMIRKK